MAIKEGYAVMAFDYKVLPSSKRCLFEMTDSKLKKEAARLEKYHKSPIGFMDKKIKELAALADQQILQNLPPIDISQTLNDPNVKKVIETLSDQNTQKVIQEGI